jgi:hypothetical protein
VALNLGARAEVLLSPAVLHPLAQWNGTTGGPSGLLYPAELAALVDGNPGTIWQSVGYTKYQPTPTLTSPAPFVVTSITVVAPPANPDRAAGLIEILPVGQANYISTGITIPSTLTAGQTYSVNLPPEFQIPISGIRHNGGHWVEMGELQFYGSPLGSGAIDITQAGTLLTTPGAESPAGSLRNGVLEDGATAYHAPNSNHRLVVDFGALPQDVTYVAFNANAYWKFPLQAVGSPTTPVNLNALTPFGDWVNSTYTQVGGTDNPGHSWIIMPLSNGSAVSLYGAGFRINNYWGDVSEIVLLVPEPASALGLALGACLLLRRRRPA